jgi:two-component system chemotaxis response regulator CheB
VGLSEEQLAQVVRTAARARVHPRSPLVAQVAAKVTRGAPASRPARPVPTPLRRSTVLPERVLAIGCSTGGPRALTEVIPHLPANLPAAVLIVQHMPAGFTRSLAERLNQTSPLHVKEAEEGDLPAAGSVLVAPGGRHMRLEPNGRVALSDAPPVHGVRPSVDVLFESLPAVFGRRIVAAVLTGMGSDGADGAACLRAAGGQIVVEDQTTAVVYGMPRAVAERGLAHRELPLREVAGALTDLVLNERAAVAHATPPLAGQNVAAAALEGR